MAKRKSKAERSDDALGGRPAKRDKLETHVDKKKERTPWPADQTWSKSKKKRMRANKSKLVHGSSEKHDANPPGKNSTKNSVDGSSISNVEETPNTSSRKEIAKQLQGSPSSTNNNDSERMEKQQHAPSSASSVLQSKFKERLLGSRFRILNEELYTTTSEVAYERFKKNPKLFTEYHDGFRYQVQDWPINPVNVIVRRIKNKFSKRKEGDKQKLVVADFGCGEAQLAKDLLSCKIQQNNKAKEDKATKVSKHKSQYCPFTVHSFDLVSPNEYVTACDMCNVPLEANTVDVGVFCLSLMGTNIADFIREAYRVLKDDGGELIIAEVRSRFESSAGKDELNKFTEVLEKLGFQCNKIDRSHQLFMILELQKLKTDENKIDPNVEFTAKPCIYKRR